jgi:hypothetical protein
LPQQPQYLSFHPQQSRSLSSTMSMPYPLHGPCAYPVPVQSHPYCEHAANKVSLNTVRLGMHRIKYRPSLHLCHKLLQLITTLFITM